MPYDDNSPEQLIRYREIITSISHDMVCNPGCRMNLIGDFNASPSRPRLGRLGDLDGWLGEILELCRKFQFTVSDLTLPNVSVTFLSPIHDTTSWIDHMTSSPDII